MRSILGRVDSNPRVLPLEEFFLIDFKPREGLPGHYFGAVCLLSLGDAVNTHV